MAYGPMAFPTVQGRLKLVTAAIAASEVPQRRVGPAGWREHTGLSTVYAGWGPA